MRRFVGSAWFGFLACLLFAGASVAAFVLLKPTGADIGNGEILKVMNIAAWAIGPVVALISLILIFILNGLRRLFRLRQVSWLHPIVVFLGVLPFFILSWQLAGEPPYTPVARAVTAFLARPMLWGAFASTAWCLLGLVLVLIPQKKA